MNTYRLHKEKKKEVHIAMLNICKGKSCFNEMEYMCLLDNDDYDYEAMARFIIKHIKIKNVFKDKILTFYPNCLDDNHLINRGVY